MRSTLIRPTQLSGNALKILAALAMTVDHVGMTLFPGIQAMRFIGRLAFPIFAFMVAEGCAHTRSMGRYFLHMVVLALVCQSAYTIAMHSWFLCVPVSFALSIPLILTLQTWKKADDGPSKTLWAVVFLAGVVAVWMLTRYVTLDYGFWGCMMPVAASMFRDTDTKLDRNLIHVLAMGAVMVPVALSLGSWQWWSMLALPLLLLYSGRRGKYKMKYFFYIFYPAHLLVIQGISMLIK